MECLYGLLMVAIGLCGIIGLGWLVVVPLARVPHVSTDARFQLIDLFGLVVLLQPSLAFLGWLIRNGNGEIAPAIVFLLVPVSAGTLAAWLRMTGALSKAGIISTHKRGAALLLILPMVCVFIPAFMTVTMMFLGLLLAGYNPYASLPKSAIPAHIVFSLIAVAAIFGARRLMKWIASGAPANEAPNQSNQISRTGS